MMMPAMNLKLLFLSFDFTANAMPPANREASMIDLDPCILDYSQFLLHQVAVVSELTYSATYMPSPCLDTHEKM